MAYIIIRYSSGRELEIRYPIRMTDGHIIYSAYLSCASRAS